MLLSTNNLIEADKENQTASAAKEAVQKYLNIQKRVVIQDYDETIFDFLTKYEEGKIVIIPKWLQRLMRVQVWEQNNWKNIREYVYSFFTGESNLQPFYIVPIDHMLEQVEIEKQYITHDLSLKAFNEIIQILKNHKKDGAEYVLLDGQNRLDVALKPFFNSEMRITKKVKKTNKKTGEVTEEEKHIECTDYPRDFLFEKSDGSVDSFNKFQFKYLPESAQNILKTTMISVKCAVHGTIRDITQSLVNLNKNNAWSEIEHGLIELTPLNYKINDKIFECDFTTSLFGNLKTRNGHISDMSDKYHLEVKGHGRFLLELTTYAHYNGIQGFGNVETNVNLTRTSDDKNSECLGVFDKQVFPFIEWLSISYDCVQSPDLTKSNMPFTKELVRNLFILIQIMTCKDNKFHSQSLVKIPKGFKDFVKSKQFIDDFIDFHKGQIDPEICPQNFDNNGKRKNDTYPASLLTIAKDAINNRGNFLLKYIESQQSKWTEKNYFNNFKDYRKLLESKRQAAKHIDQVTGFKISRKSSLSSLDHTLAKNGPNKGTDEDKNIRFTNLKTNIKKSNKI
jgi:hypothetical protein